MSLAGFLLFAAFLVLLLYWFDGMSAIESARNAGRHSCQRSGVTFLDETVALDKMRICRSQAGRMRLCRNYRFEFASDGNHRYHGMVEMSGKTVTAVSMEPWRMVDEGY